MINIWELDIGDSLDLIVIVQRKSLQEFNLVLDVQVLKCVHVQNVRIWDNHQSFPIDSNSIETILRGGWNDLIQQEHILLVVDVQDDDWTSASDEQNFGVGFVGDELLRSEIVDWERF